MLPKTKTPRNSAVELLRILAMGMIILSHACYHGGYGDTYSPASINRLFLQFGYLGNLGVDLFVLISGYFQCRIEFRSRSLSKILSQVWFYSVVLYGVCCFGFGRSLPLLDALLPTIFGTYWFVTAYVVLLLLSPYLNRLIHNLTKGQLNVMIGVMGLLWAVIPTLTKQSMYGGALQEFVLLYCIGAWLRLYPEGKLEQPKYRWALAILPMAALYVLTVVLAYCERLAPEAFGASVRFYDRSSLFILATATGLMALAAYAKPFSSRIINTVSGCTFGVYLIHDHPLVRELLWEDWLNWEEYFTSGSFILRILLSVVLVYVVCTGIEWLRQKTVAEPMTNLWDKALSRLKHAERVG